MHTVLVVANETLGGRSLIEAVLKRKEKGEVRFALCVPRTRPKAGLVIYDDAVFDAAQARVDLALGFVHAEGIDAVGEVGDPDPYTATMDAVLDLSGYALGVAAPRPRRAREPGLGAPGRARGLRPRHRGPALPGNARRRQPHGHR